MNDCVQLKLLFFFNDTATTEIYTLSLHDALPIFDALCDGDEVFLGGVMEHIEEAGVHSGDSCCTLPPVTLGRTVLENVRDRKSTRLNSSHANISYAVFCLKKKKTHHTVTTTSTTL